MGNADTKLNFRKAVVQLTSKTQVKVIVYYFIQQHMIYLTFRCIKTYTTFFAVCITFN